MTTVDVLIVGGGPAGSTCAWALKRAGWNVLVRDRACFPRDKPCAGWITPGVVRLLELDLTAYASGGRTCQPIRGFVVGREGGRAIRTQFREPVSYGICRREFDAYLLDRSGAECVLGEPVRSIRREGRWWVLDEAYRAPLLIGAGGHFCPVARTLGARTGTAEPAIHAQEVEYRMSPESAAACAIDPELPELTFCRDLRGYGWCFRKGEILNVGLGRWAAPKDPLAAHVAAYCESLVREGRLPEPPPGRWLGHAYVPSRITRRPLLDDGVMLVGDAAGMAYPESGEGIAPAVESALLATTTALEAAGRYDRARLEAYRRRVHERFGAPSKSWGRSATITIPSRWLPIARALLDQPWFNRNVVMRRWFLRAHVPPLSLHSPGLA